MLLWPRHIPTDRHVVRREHTITVPYMGASPMAGLRASRDAGSRSGPRPSRQSRLPGTATSEATSKRGRREITPPEKLSRITKKRGGGDGNEMQEWRVCVWIPIDHGRRGPTESDRRRGLLGMSDEPVALATSQAVRPSGAVDIVLARFLECQHQHY